MTCSGNELMPESGDVLRKQGWIDSDRMLGEEVNGRMAPMAERGEIFDGVVLPISINVVSEYSFGVSTEAATGRVQSTPDSRAGDD